MRAGVGLLAGTALITAGLGLLAVPAAASTYTVSTETDFRTAWTDPLATEIDLGASISLGCNGVAFAGVSVRDSPTAVVLDGHGFTITQTCATGTDNGVLEQDGSGTVTLQNVTITGGRAASGAAASGGGIDVTNASASLTVTDATVSNNDVTGGGCGAFCASEGGAIYAAGPLTVTGSTFTNNNGRLGCGGICGAVGGAVEADDSATVTGSTFSGNSTTTGCRDDCGSTGGALAVVGALTLNGSTVDGNTASTGCGFECGSDGGGIATQASSTVTDSTVANNTASTRCGSDCGSDGGGIDAEPGGITLTVTNSTIADNTASGDGAGGGVLFFQVILVYATVSGNAAPNGANLLTSSLTSFASVVANPSGGANCLIPSSSTTSNGFNLEDDPAATCGFATSTGDLPPGTTAGLGALASNGPTQTLLPDPGSPLLDAVPIADCRADGAASVTFDQRGVTRPQGAGCDVGAVEVVVAAPTALIVAAFTG